MTLCAENNREANIYELCTYCVIMVASQLELLSLDLKILIKLFNHPNLRVLSIFAFLIQSS